MIQKIKKKFTLWYIKKGYTFGYEYSGTEFVYYDNKKVPLGKPAAVFKCPVWVRPFLIFFSPSIYMQKTNRQQIVQSFLEGIESVRKNGKTNILAEIYATKEGADDD